MRRYNFVIIAILALMLLPLAARSQMGSGRFDAEFSRTAEILERAQSVVGDAKAGSMADEFRGVVLKASSLLDLAVNLQGEAMGMGRNGRYLEGIGTTMKARERAFEAINLIRKSSAKLANPADENDNLVLRQLERTDDLIIRVQDQMTAGSQALLESLFNSAQDAQRQAWEFYHNGQYRPALKLSRQAERTLLRIGTRAENGAGSGAQVENRIQQTEQRLEQVAAMAQNCNKSEASDLYKKAMNKIAEARQEANRGDLSRAESGLAQVQAMIQKILALCSDGESLNRAITQVRAEIERVSADIRKSGNQEAISLMEAAREHLGEAETLCAKGDTDNCAANIKAAQMNIRKAERLAGI
ncbi:hypothetical protein TRIP_C20252 [Candidatus Zixiibacteriota bacterium]|nr:hypothetical protein TRIP_C20252 [candidate division Zixibacteria bacterium]